MYDTLRYNSRERWLSYWYQLNETVSRHPANLLVIGKGSGIVERTIATIAPDIDVVTVDINPGLSPEVVADVRHLPFRDSSFDCILCCQVLEHLPFRELRGLMEEFDRVVRDAVIVSIPQKRKHLKIEIDAPLIGRKVLILKNPMTKRRINSRQHFWEINRGVSLGEIRDTLKEFFVIEKTFLNELGCNQRFFILRKRW